MGYLSIPSIVGGRTGNVLAFRLAAADGNYDLYVMDAADAADLVRLDSRCRGLNERPSWAPDGGHIVFASTAEAGISGNLGDAGWTDRKAHQTDRHGAIMSPSEIGR